MTTENGKPWGDLKAYRAAFRARCPVPEAVLPALAERQQWLVWRYERGETPEKKPRKMPYYASTGFIRGWPNGRPRDGKPTDDFPKVEQGHPLDRAHLVSFETAKAVVSRLGMDGVGFAFLPGDGLIGIDLDGMIVDGVPNERCAAIIEACSSYTEVSPSGTGVHVFALREHEEGLRSFKSNAAGVEVFVGAQFFTFTGACYPGPPFELSPLGDETLGRLRATVEAARGRPHSSAPAAPSINPSSPGDSPASNRSSPVGSTPAPAQPNRGGRSLAQDLATVEEALGYLSPDDYQEWITVGLALKNTFSGSGAAYAVWDAWSGRSQKYAGADDTLRRWSGMNPSSVSMGTVYQRAEEAGWKSPWAKARERGRPHVASRTYEFPDASPPLSSSSRLDHPPAGALKGGNGVSQGGDGTADDGESASYRFNASAGDDVGLPLAEAGGGEAGASAMDEDRDWASRIIYKGKFISDCLANAELFLSWMPDWRGVLAYDEFAERVVYRRRPPFMRTGPEFGEWSDYLDKMTAIWLQRVHETEFSPNKVGQAVEVVARANRYHPVREALAALAPWDGIDRLEMWPMDFLGVADSPYARLVAKWSVMSIVKRVLHPGCKHDYCIVLEGPQGDGKSGVARIFGWHWFGDTDLNLESKDALLGLPGHLVYEIAEMGSLMKAEEKKQKSFLSRQEDEYRPPFGKRTIKVSRQCSFWGTTNEAEYLKDPTGARRFWPLLTNETADEFDLAGLRSVHPALMAEALARVRAGERTWPTKDEQRELFDPEQRKRGMPEPFDEILARWVEKQYSTFTMADACMEGLSLTPDKLTPALVTRVGIALRKMKCGRDENRGASGADRRPYIPPHLVASYRRGAGALPASGSAFDAAF